MYDKCCILYLPVFAFVHVQKLSMMVKTDGSHSLEENMRQTLLACYREFAEILKQMAITHVYLVCLCMCGAMICPCVFPAHPKDDMLCIFKGVSGWRDGKIK